MNNMPSQDCLRCGTMRNLLRSNKHRGIVPMMQLLILTTITTRSCSSQLTVLEVVLKYAGQLIIPATSSPKY